MSEVIEQIDEQDRFGRIFKPGAFWGILGPPGSGKSTLLMNYAQAALNHGWIVFSNVKLHKWHPKLKRFKSDMVSHYHFVTTWGEIFALLPRYVGMQFNEETGKMELRNRIMLGVDELLMSEMGGGKTLQSGKTRSAVSIAAQARKLGITIVVVAQSEKMITGAMRVGQLLFGYMRKVRKPPYTAQEIVRFEIPNPDIIRFDPDNPLHYKMTWRKVVPKGIARSQEMIWRSPEEGYDPNAVIYISETPAALTLGTYPDTKEPFNIDHMLEVLGKTEPEDVAEAIAKEMQNPPRPGAAIGPTSEEESEDGVPEQEHEGGTPTGEIKNTIVSLYKSGMSRRQITDRLGKGRRSQVYLYCEKVDNGEL
jgi:energy-coupling factor transporter ATP-binding protein EcfA2